jgi:hypothetical protein
MGNYDKGDELNMSPTGFDQKKSSEIKPNFDKTHKTSENLNVKNGVIQLDKNNPFHKQWFENDEDYDI